MAKKKSEIEKSKKKCHNIETCACLSCRLTRVEILLAEHSRTLEDILIPNTAQNLRKEGKVLVQRPDGRYAVGTIPQGPQIKRHPDNCPCELCSRRNKK